MLRGLPSREWRSMPISDYGATRQPVPTWRDKILPWVAYFLDKIRMLCWTTTRLYRGLWAWALSRRTRATRTVLAGSILIVTFILITSAVLRTLNWISKEDPCSVLERAKVGVMEEEETQGVFTPLPKVVHYAWDSGNIPTGRLLEWNNELRRLFPKPEFQHKFWTREAFLDLVKEKYDWYESTATEITEPLQSWREAKYIILNEYGGLFVAPDYKVLRQFWDVLPKHRPAYLASPYLYGSDIEDSVLSSPAGHPLWNVTLGLIRQRIEQLSWFANARVLAQAVRELKQSSLGQDAVAELPCELFYRFPHGEAAEFVPESRASLRQFMASMGLIKPCGDVENIRCQLGMYYESAAVALGSS